MNFKKGQRIVYPGHGVGVVDRLETKDILGAKREFCILKIRHSGMVIMIPVNNSEVLGIRPIVTKAQAHRILRTLNSQPKVNFKDTWSMRYREYMDSIKTGDLLAIATVFAAIKQFRIEHELSFGERKMLDTARALLVEEISLALDLPGDEIETLFSVAGGF